MSAEPPAPEFSKLLEFLSQIPALKTANSCFGSGRFDDGNWWVKFSIDIEHSLAWSTVQELGYVLNYLSLKDRLPTVLKPVSPPPYLNGGPEFLSWVIESSDPKFSPDMAVEWLVQRMPSPVDDPDQWPVNQQD
jgi:hypothetical protein